jgi:hypothetical protein
LLSDWQSREASATTTNKPSLRIHKAPRQEFQHPIAEELAHDPSDAVALDRLFADT